MKKHQLTKCKTSNRSNGLILKKVCRKFLTATMSTERQLTPNIWATFSASMMSPTSNSRPSTSFRPRLSSLVNSTVGELVDSQAMVSCIPRRSKLRDLSRGNYRITTTTSCQPVPQGPPTSSTTTHVRVTIDATTEPQRPPAVNQFYNYSQSCSTSGPVTTWISDCLRRGKPSWHVINSLDQLSLPSLWGR